MALSIQNGAICAGRPAKPTSVWGKIASFAGLARQRRALARLDAHLLKDIGITAEQARQESEKPVWNVPSHWQN